MKILKVLFIFLSGAAAFVSINGYYFNYTGAEFYVFLFLSGIFALIAGKILDLITALSLEEKRDFLKINLRSFGFLYLNIFSLFLKGPQVLKYIFIVSVNLQVFFIVLNYLKNYKTPLNIKKYYFFFIPFLIYIAAMPGVRLFEVHGDEVLYQWMAESIYQTGNLNLLETTPRWAWGNIDFINEGETAGYCRFMWGYSVIIGFLGLFLGKNGMVLTNIILTAFFSYVFFLFLRKFKTFNIAFKGWIIFFMSAPSLIYSGQIYSEITAGFLVLTALYYLLSGITLKNSLIFSLVVILIPFIHYKYALFSAALFIVSIFEFYKREKIKLFFVVCAMGALGLLMFACANYFVFGSPAGSYFQKYPGHTQGVYSAVLGLFFDAQTGLLFFAPFFLICGAGMYRLIKQNNYLFLKIIFVFSSYYIIIARWLFWQGAASPVVRFITPLWWVIAFFTAFALKNKTNFLEKLLFWFTFILAFLFNVVIKFRYWYYYEINFYFDYIKRFLSLDFSKVLPVYGSDTVSVFVFKTLIYAALFVIFNLWYLKFIKKDES